MARLSRLNHPLSPRASRNGGRVRNRVNRPPECRRSSRCGDFSDRGAVRVSMVFVCLSQRLPSCLRRPKAHASLICNSPNEITTAQRFPRVESQRELRRNGGRISEFQPSATGGNVANATVQNTRPTAWKYYASRRRNPRASDASPFDQTGPVNLTLFLHNSADQVSRCSMRPYFGQWEPMS